MADYDLDNDETADVLGNHTAPRMTKRQFQPPRICKNMYMQEKIALQFDQLVFEQKKIKGQSGPELIETAITDLIAKHQNI